MARFAAVLCALVAAVTSVGAAPASVDLIDRGVIAAVPGTSPPLATFFTDGGYAGLATTFVDEETTGCIAATGAFVNSVSSLNHPNIACNLWSELNCGGHWRRPPPRRLSLYRQDGVVQLLQHSLRGFEPELNIIVLLPLTSASIVCPYIINS
ncbi:hypothetical protein B0H19DRAFT_1174132 [Mycena capillaripes]|nr:hypothetical protein B0H19DRAFT_1174132 [Mycena capillaripes]